MMGTGTAASPLAIRIPLKLTGTTSGVAPPTLNGTPGTRGPGLAVNQGITGGYAAVASGAVSSAATSDGAFGVIGVQNGANGAAVYGMTPQLHPGQPGGYVGLICR